MKEDVAVVWLLGKEMSHNLSVCDIIIMPSYNAL